MKYIVCLVVFSTIGSFFIADTITFWRDFRKGNSLKSLYLDFFRLLVLASMASIGYVFASQTFHQPNDGLIFLAIGIMGAFLIRIFSSLNFFRK